MIILHDICKRYKTSQGYKVVLDRVSYTFVPGESVGILGRNGAGKSTLMRIIGGEETPDSGWVERRSKVSWPIGFSGGFNKHLTGRENMRFVCRLYEQNYKKIASFVEDFSGLGAYMDMPVETYSSGMKAKLTFGLSMAFNFDFYLIDEVTAVGDAVFKRKSEAYFAERRKHATLIVVSHSMGTIKKFCNKMLVLYEGSLHNFPTNEEAERFYDEVCCADDEQRQSGKAKPKKQKSLKSKA